MTKNMGKLDRTIRVVVAIALIVSAFTGILPAAGLWHWLALVVAAVFLLTSVLGNCPLYSILGIRTCRA